MGDDGHRRDYFGFLDDATRGWAVIRKADWRPAHNCRPKTRKQKTGKGPDRKRDCGFSGGRDASTSAAYHLRPALSGTIMEPNGGLL